jgi:restriction system protein
MSRAKGQAQFVRWFGPLLDALRALGGKAEPRECSDWIADKYQLSPDLIEAKMKSGNERFHNQVQWARQYLVWEGLVESPQRGVWMLTPKGAKLNLDETASRELFLKWVQIHQQSRKQKHVDSNGQIEIDEEPQTPEEVEEQSLLNVLQSLPSEGFERLCQRILREYGFEHVVVLGKSHDGGIDGIGILRLNPFVGFKVMFQCKRYMGAVSRAQVGDFRNAVMGRADKGIFITTGWFSSDAEKEASRDGVIPIELIDGELLVQLFEAKLLGLKRKDIFEIDHSFFAQFR